MGGVGKFSLNTRHGHYTRLFLFVCVILIFYFVYRASADAVLRAMASGCVSEMGHLPQSILDDFNFISDQTSDRNLLFRSKWDDVTIPTFLLAGSIIQFVLKYFSMEFNEGYTTCRIRPCKVLRRQSVSLKLYLTSI